MTLTDLPLTHVKDCSGNFRYFYLIFSFFLISQHAQVIHVAINDRLMALISSHVIHGFTT